MSKRDYDQLAQALRDTYDLDRGLGSDVSWWQYRMIRAVADSLDSTEDRFDRDRFLEAATGGRVG